MPGVLEVVHHTGFYVIKTVFLILVLLKSIKLFMKVWSVIFPTYCMCLTSRPGKRNVKCKDNDDEK